MANKMQKENNSTPTNEIDIVSILKIVWRKRSKLLLWSGIGLFAGIVIAFSIPKEYRTIVKFTTESSKKSQGSMGELAGFIGLNLNSDAPDGINSNLYPEVIKSTPFMSDIATIEVTLDGQKMPMYEYVFNHQKKAWWAHIVSLPSTLANLSSEKDSIDFQNNANIQKSFADFMSQKILMSLDKKTEVYIISCSFQDPVISAQIADSMLYKLQRYITSYKTRKTRSNLESNLKILADAQLEYYTADSLYAQKSDRNLNLTMKGAQIKVERLQNERDLAFQVYQQMASQVATDRIKLQEETPIATIIEPPIKPNSPASPNKLMIIIFCGFLGAIAIAAKLIIKEFNSQHNN